MDKAQVLRSALLRLDDILRRPCRAQDRVGGFGLLPSWQHLVAQALDQLS